MARAATSPELTLLRAPGHASRLYAAILQPATIYQARVNQTFTTTDGVLEITYDGGSGTLADVLPDMALLVGTSAGARDIGITRVRSIDATKIYIGETSDIPWTDNLYLTVINDFGLWARHVLLDSSGTAFMDGGIEYSDQHSRFDPTPIMGPHRVLKLEGVTVETAFDWSGSYVVDGTAIAAYATSAPTASAISGETTDAPTVTFDATGWHPVYLTVTTAESEEDADDGKSFFGVRWVYVWNEDDPPASASIESCQGSADSGGWEFRLTLYDNVDRSLVHERALVILFAEDWYGATKQSIGPIEGAENVIAIGWIADETIAWTADAGQVTFTAHGAHFWLGRIPSFPDGVEFTSVPPTAWTEIQELTIDKGVWHFLHWRTTCTRIMDVKLSGDARYTQEVSSLGESLWDQLREMAFLQIFARAGVDRYNRLFVEVHPQLVPAGSRDWPTVMTITKQDWAEEIQLDRITVPPVALVNLSGIAVNASGGGAAFFSLSPGHAYPHFGKLEIVDNLLVSTQGQANTLAGLYRAWLNNPYPEIPITLSANNRLIDCFPRQNCGIVIGSSDTPRGIEYAGNLIPASVAFVPDPEAGYLHTEVTFEAETFADLAIDGDVPGSRADVSVPPPPAFPKLPSFPIILPGVSEESDTGPTKVLIHDLTLGLLYCEDFDAASPTWTTINAGLTTAQYQAVNFLAICPNGAVYAGFIDNARTNDFLARAPSIGGTFVLQTYPDHLVAAAINPLVSEQIAILTNSAHLQPATFRIGANNSFAAPGAVITEGFTMAERLSYGFGHWLFTTYDAFVRINGAGSSAASGSPGSLAQGHLRASTTGRTFHNLQTPTTSIRVGENNLTTSTVIGLSPTVIAFDDGGVFNPLLVGDCDPTGTYLMARATAGSLGTRAKSSDAGATWTSIGLTLPVGNWYFRNASTPQRWVAAAQTVHYSENFGSSWVSKSGNLTTLYAFPNINMVRVVEA